MAPQDRVRRLWRAREPSALFYRRQPISFAIDFADFDESRSEWLFARYALAQKLGVTGIGADAFHADVNERRASHGLSPVPRPAADTLRILITDPQRVYYSLTWVGVVLLAGATAGARAFVNGGVAWVREHRELRRSRRTYVEIYGPDGGVLKRVRVRDRPKFSVRRYAARALRRTRRNG